MADHRDPSSSRHRASSEASGRRSGMYAQRTNASEVSLFQDVEMAEDEIFSGPIAESVPTATSSFGHRRERADSNASFAYYEEGQDDDGEDSGEWTPEEAILDDDRDLEELDGNEHFGDSNGYTSAREDDLEAGSIRPSLKARKSSGASRRTRDSQRGSVDAPLLQRKGSSESQRSGWETGARVSQKVYLATEDLTIVIAGFKTSLVGYAIYLSICICTAGLGYLLFRWLPKWRVRLTGKATPLSKCDWVVVENQWNEMAVHHLRVTPTELALSAVFGPSSGLKYRDYDEYDDPILDELRILDYRYIRFCFHPIRDKFVLGSTWKDPNWTSVQKVRAGIDADDHEQRESIFGKNVIDIEEKTVGQLLVDEALHPFYIFQIASLILWSADQYYYYAACIFIISIISITSTLVETKATMKRLREISRFECEIRVLRGGFWRYVESGDLVPGDVYEVTDPNLGLFPCDSLLLSGDCIVNESMLTGESVPVSKTPATDESLDLLDLGASSIHPEVARHLLFGGTKIIRARRPQDDKSEEAAGLALVVRTGFNTTKGALVRSMLFPKPSGFKFYRDSFRYISVMAMIAGIGFIASFINFIRLELQWHLIIVRALDLITIVVPPALPATLTIGTNFALSRLKQKQIFCISPQRVNVGGKLDVMCFDKTGTLTEEGLDVLGVRVVQRPANRFSEILTDAIALLPGPLIERDPTIDYAANKAILHTMATCHSLRIVDDQFIGDPSTLR